MLAAVRMVGNESSLGAFSSAFADVVTDRDRSHCHRECVRCVNL